MVKTYLALGTNLGKRDANLRAAIEDLPRGINVLCQSPIYETPPWGITDQPAFLNMALEAETSLDPFELLGRLKDIERSIGRTASVRWGPRLIDIDILFYGNLILEQDGLIIPHPLLQERAFVLVPLADIAPNLVHPVLGKTIAELLSRVDVKGIRRLESVD